MFKLTERAEKHENFIIHISRQAGAINFTNRFDSIEEAVERESAELGFSIEEMTKLTKNYSKEELLEAAEDGCKWPITLRLVEEVEEAEEEAEAEEVEEERTPQKNFIIHHTAESGDFNLTEDYASIEEAVECEAQGADCSVEEMAKRITSYTAEEVIEAAERGEGWPEKLGLAEEKKESYEESTMNTTAPARFFNFDCHKGTFFFSNEKKFSLIDSADFVAFAEAKHNPNEHSFSINAEAIFMLPGDEKYVKNDRLLDALSELSSKPVGEQSTPWRLEYDPRYGRSINAYTAHKDVRGLMKELTNSNTSPSGEPCWPTIRHQEMRWGCEGNDTIDYFFHLVAIVAYCEDSLEKRKSALIESIKQKALALIEEESVK